MDYTSIAQSLYNPDIQAESASDTTKYNDVLATNATDTNTANDAFTKASNTATSTKQGNDAKDLFTASSRGLGNSGLAANAERLTYGSFQTAVQTANQTRADKLAAISTKGQNAENEYNAEEGALSTKYQSEVNCIKL